MKNIILNVTNFLRDNNTQIFVSALLLLLVTVSYTKSTTKQRETKRKYEEMEYKLDSVMYENYKLENSQMLSVMEEDSLAEVEWLSKQK